MQSIKDDARIFIPKCNCLLHLFTKIRDRDTRQAEFVNYSRRIIRIIFEEGLTFLPCNNITVATPTSSFFSGIHIVEENLIAVSIIRSGDAMLEALNAIYPTIAVGKILIQRDETTSNPCFFYKKLPDLVDKKILLLDPMLATGGSAMMAIEVLLQNGALEKNILFFSVISCPEGISRLLEAFPDIRLVTGCIDEYLNEQKYIIPGLGDFGDRYYGTT